MHSFVIVGRIELELAHNYAGGIVYYGCVDIIDK